MYFLKFFKSFNKLIIFIIAYQTISATKDRKEKFILLKTQIQTVYDILANLQIYTIKMPSKDFLEEYFVDFPSNEVFFRLGEVPEYLHRKNFKNKILIKKLSLFNTRECQEMICFENVYLGIYDKFIGFVTSLRLKHEIQKTMISGSSYDLQLRPTINETIGTFTVLHIYSSRFMSTTISTDTTIINGGVYLEKFPFYSMCQNHKYFVALFSYVRSMLCLSHYITKVYTDHEEYIIRTTILPPMFMLLNKFQDEMVFGFFGPKGITNEFIILQYNIYNKPSHVIEYIIQEPLSTSFLDENEINVCASILPALKIYATDSKAPGNILSVKYNGAWSITFTTNRTWKVNLSLTTNMRTNVKFEFSTRIADSVSIIIPFEGYTILEEQWVRRTTKVNNTRGLMSLGLQQISDIIKKGGNLICKIIGDNNSEETYILNFDYNNRHILMMEDVETLPKFLYPYISYMKQKNTDLCSGIEPPLLSTIPEDKLLSRDSMTCYGRNLGKKRDIIRSLQADFDEEDHISSVNEEYKENKREQQPEHIYIRTITDSSSQSRRSRRISSSEDVSEIPIKTNEPVLPTRFCIERPEYRSFYDSEEELNASHKRFITPVNEIDKKLKNHNNIDKHLVICVCLSSIFIIFIGICFFLVRK